MERASEMAVKKKTTVTNAVVNAFIRDNGPKCRSWVEMAQRLAAELGVTMTRKQVADRAYRQGAKLSPRPVTTKKPTSTSPVAEGVLRIVKKKSTIQSVEDLANALVTSPAIIRKALDELKGSGHNIVTAQGNVELSRDIPKAPPLRIDINKMKGKTFKFGVTADNHLCSKYERLDVLEALYDIWAAEGITTVYQLGNMIDGDARFNKFDVLCTGMEAQARYAAKNWPKRKGISTYFITGDDHEGWYVQREGVEVGRYIEGVAKAMGREDMTYLGHMEHDIFFSGKKQTSVMRLIHAGGGSAYATSYAAQKIVESYQGGEKPHVLLVGHYHKAEYGYPREVHVVQAGCTCDQTPFLRKNKIQAHVGGWTIEMTINADGVITRFRQEWIPFFDKGFYDKSWKYLHAA